jgi:hypothetical protein
MQYLNLSMVAYHQNQPSDIDRLAKKGIQVYQEVNSVFGIITTFPKLAGAAFLSGNLERAARLLGASQELLDGIGSRFQPNDRAELDRLIEEIEGAMGKEDYQAEWAKGAAMNYAEAMAYALEPGE